MMQPPPTDEMRFLAKYGELMALLASAVELYDVDLRKHFRELLSIYSMWVKDFAFARPYSDRIRELDRLEFSVYCTISQELIEGFSKLVSDLEKPLFVDTSRYKIAIAEAKRKKTATENQILQEDNIEKCVASAKTNVEELFEHYSNCKAECGNLSRRALFKWCGVMAAVYSIIMVVYFGALNSVKTSIDFTLVISVPVFVGMLMLGGLLLWFPSLENEE
jgi:hypothetical protein